MYFDSIPNSGGMKVLPTYALAICIPMTAWEFSLPKLSGVEWIIAGYIGVQEIVGEAYITNVAVSEKFRRRGIAEKLLEEAERGAIKRGCVLITLEVRASNDPAKALYKKRGFKEVGTRKNFYSDPCEDAEIMTKFFDR